MITEITNKIVIDITEERKVFLKGKIQSYLKNTGNDIDIDIDINFEDNYPLYFGGKELEEGVFVRIEVYNRKQDREKYRILKDEITTMYINELGLVKQRVFVQFDDYEK